MSQVNVDRLLQVVGQIALNPERHNQGSWFSTSSTRTGKEIRNSCGTTGCFAGWASFFFSGDNAVYSPNNTEVVYVPNPNGDYVLENNKVVDAYYSVRFHDRSERLNRVDIKQHAAGLLGLSTSQANYLFAGYRTKEQLFAGVKYLMHHPDATSGDLEHNAIVLGIAN